METGEHQIISPLSHCLLVKNFTILLPVIVDDSLKYPNNGSFVYGLSLGECDLIGIQISFFWWLRMQIVLKMLSMKIILR